MATKSPGKFVQSVGRGMRICGKTNCLVLDFGGNTARLGTIDNIQAPAKKTKGEGDGEARERVPTAIPIYSGQCGFRCRHTARGMKVRCCRNQNG